MKKILAVFVCLILVFCVSNVYAEKTKISVFVSYDAGSGEADIFEKVAQRFTETHPDIELDIERLPHDAFHSKLQAMAVAKQLPDVVTLWPGKRTSQVPDAGLVKDLRPFLKGKEDQFVPFALSAQGKNGELWELPGIVTTTHIVFTNTKLLKQLGLTYPKTLDELVAQSAKIREAGYIPIAMGNKAAWPLQSCLMSTLTERAGGMDWFNKAIKGDGVSFADPEFINALTVLKTLTENKVFIPGMNQLDRTQAVGQFIQEKAVYCIEGSWRVSDLQKQLSDEQKEYVEFYPFPEIPNQKGQANSISAVPGTGFGMNAKLTGAKADAAWQWIWFWAGPEASEIRLNFGMIPAYKLAPSEDADPLVKKLSAYSVAYPMGYVLDDKLDAEGMMNVLNPGLQEITMGSKDPKQLAEEFEAWVAANDSNRKK